MLEQNAVAFYDATTTLANLRATIWDRKSFIDESDGSLTLAKPITYEELNIQYRDIDTRLRDELGAVRMLVLNWQDQRYYEPAEPLFGAKVEKRFPNLSEDISEAGKCLALGRTTACVFHLMRVMEAALQGFGDKMGVALVGTKNWQNILDETNKAIRQLNQKDKQTIACAGAAAHLYNVKLAWRNEVMHPKQTYISEEAGGILSSVRTFVGDLAGLD